MVVENITMTPRLRKTGKFAIEMLHTGTNPRGGNLGQGDVAKIYFEAPMPVGEYETVRISLVPKIGTPSLIEFDVPYSNSEVIYLWP